MLQAKTTAIMLSLSAAAHAYQTQEAVRNPKKEPRHLQWSLEDSLYRQGYLSPQPDHHHWDVYGEYDHGLAHEHQIMTEGSDKLFYRDGR